MIIYVKIQFLPNDRPRPLRLSFSTYSLYSHQNNANRGGALVSDDESDEGEEGDYTVYECPGLATVSTYLTPVMINLKRDVFTMFYLYAI